MIDEKKLLEKIDALQKPTMDSFGNFLSDYEQGRYDALSDLEMFIESQKEEDDNIDWEQRRYEVAKAALAGILAGPTPPPLSPSSAKRAILETKDLIYYLKSWHLYCKKHHIK